MTSLCTLQADQVDLCLKLSKKLEPWKSARRSTVTVSVDRTHGRHRVSAAAAQATQRTGEILELPYNSRHNFALVSHPSSNMHRISLTKRMSRTSELCTPMHHNEVAREDNKVITETRARVAHHVLCANVS